MSRALNIKATLNDVTASCAKHAATISAIETLPSGVIRVVLCSGDGAALIKRHYGSKVITTPVARTPRSIAARGVPLTEEMRPSTSAPISSPASKARRA